MKRCRGEAKVLKRAYSKFLESVLKKKSAVIDSLIKFHTKKSGDAYLSPTGGELGGTKDIFAREVPF